jgi:hypothetical protein
MNNVEPSQLERRNCGVLVISDYRHHSIDYRWSNFTFRSRLQYYLGKGLDHDVANIGYILRNVFMFNVLSQRRLASNETNSDRIQMGYLSPSVYSLQVVDYILIIRLRYTCCWRLCTSWTDAERIWNLCLYFLTFGLRSKFWNKVNQKQFVLQYL